MDFQWVRGPRGSLPVASSGPRKVWVCNRGPDPGWEAWAGDLGRAYPSGVHGQPRAPGAIDCGQLGFDVLCPLDWAVCHTREDRVGQRLPLTQLTRGQDGRAAGVTGSQVTGWGECSRAGAAAGPHHTPPCCTPHRLYPRTPLCPTFSACHRSTSISLWDPASLPSATLVPCQPSPQTQSGSPASPSASADTHP